MPASETNTRIVQWIARDVRGPNREVKEVAIDRLGLVSGSTELLVAGLADSDPDIRIAAAVNLGRVRRPSALPALVRAARNESSDDVLCHIVGALAGYTDPTILDVLLNVLGQSKREYLVRMEVVIQLWKYDPGIVWPRLAEVVFGSDNDIVRGHAADSLELLDEVLPPDETRQQLWFRLADDNSRGVANIATRALARKRTFPGGDVRAAISFRLRASAPEDRAFALHRLSMLAPASARELALPLLDDEQPSVRVACCACLGAIRDPAGISSLLAVLESEPEPRVQTAALLALENYHSAAIGDALLSLLERRALSGDALSIGCRQLWKYPSPRTWELLREVLASSVKLAQLPEIESTLAFLERFLRADPETSAG